MQICNYCKKKKKALEDIRNYEEFLKFMIDFEELLVIELLRKRKKRRNNPSETAEIYYKINFYYPFLDHVLNEQVAGFSKYHEKIGNLQILLPKYMKNKNDAKNKLTEIHKV
jgi:hypothetical protein